MSVQFGLRAELFAGSEIGGRDAAQPCFAAKAKHQPGEGDDLGRGHGVAEGRWEVRVFDSGGTEAD